MRLRDFERRVDDGLHQLGLFALSVTAHARQLREANDRGFRCIVLADCCASYFPEFHETGLAMIKAQGGIFGSVSQSRSLLTVLAAAR